MLDENTLNALPEAIYQRLNKINTDYLEKIGQKVREIGKLGGGDLHKLRQLQSYGADIEAEFERATRKNAAEIYDIIDAVARDVYADAAPLYSAKGLQYIPYTENTELQRYVNSIAKQTVGEYVNLSQHTAFCIFGADGTTKSFFAENSRKIPTSLSETYTRVIDEAITAAQMGVTDYNSAMRRTMKALADSGIRTVDYATGYSRRLDTAVRQNVLWGVKQCSLGTAEQVGEEFGADGWEVSYHSNPRPTHEDMGGRQYAAGSRGVTIGGVYYPPFSGGADSPEALLQDYGCLHYIFPIVLGVSEPTYTGAELAAMKANDARTFEYEGKTYTGYEATQMQRKIETAIRHEKDRANIFAASGDEEGRRQAQEKINQLTRHYAKFSKAAGLPTQKERASVSGFHRVKTKSEISKKVLTSQNQSGILQSSSKGFFGNPIHASVGAKSRDYPSVYYPGTEIPVEFVDGSRPFYPSDHTMAGRGCKTGRKIDEIDRLTDTYKCDAAGWQKEKARYEVYDENGNIRVVELHWYQHPDIGRVEYKVKTKGGYYYIDDWR
ncbi:MAG: hypothetical protein IJU41_03585 [Clostridia bacterium]|nr:hypothetical protein [Clostridia bacterium]